MRDAAGGRVHSWTGRAAAGRGRGKSERGRCESGHVRAACGLSSPCDEELCADSSADMSHSCQDEEFLPSYIRSDPN